MSFQAVLNLAVERAGRFVAPELVAVHRFAKANPTCQRCKSKPTATVMHRHADDKHVALCGNCYAAADRPASTGWPSNDAAARRARALQMRAALGL